MTFVPKSKPDAYCEVWSRSLVQLVSGLSIGDWQTECTSVPEDYAPALRFGINTDRVPGKLWVSLDFESLSAVLAVFLGGEVHAESDSTPDAVQRDASEELIRQWCGLAATALKKDLGEISFQVNLEVEASDQPSSYRRWVSVHDRGQTVAAVLEFSDVLVRSLDDLLPANASEPDGSSLAASPASLEECLQRRNLELLRDVELNVMLRFGSHQATLREVLDLANGTVLELDREIQEPVDLVLNGRVIARGEVVVIDGNYGLRVSEVAGASQAASHS